MNKLATSPKRRKIGTPAVEPLITALHDPVSYVRAYAAYALEKISEPSAFILGFEARVGAQRDPRPVGSLIAALNHPDEVVRRFEAGALGEIGDLRGVKPLIGALRDRDEEVRGNAACALGKLCDLRAVVPLIIALRDPARFVRQIAANPLGKIGDSRALQELERVALEEKDVASGLWSVAESARKAVEKIRQRISQ